MVACVIEDCGDSLLTNSKISSNLFSDSNR